MYCYSLDEIARELGGLSRERVRQIQNKALAKFERGMIAKGYSLSDVLENYEPDDCRVLPPV